MTSHEFSSPARNSADVAAYAMHQLGYWPNECLMIVTATDKHLGPVLRIDLPEPEEVPVQALLDNTLSYLPQSLPRAEKLTRYFLLFSGTHTHQRQRQLSTLNSEVPTTEEITYDGEQAQRYLPWHHAVLRANLYQPLICEDIFYLGETSRWEIDVRKEKMVFSGFLSDIQTCPVYVDFLSHGSVIHHTLEESHEANKPQPHSTLKSQQQHTWNEEFALWNSQFHQAITEPTNAYCLNYLAQKEAENALWDATIKHLHASQRQRFTYQEKRHLAAVKADHLREKLSPHLAAYLLNTLTSLTSAQFLLFTAATSLKQLQYLMASLEKEHGQPEASDYPLVLPADVGKSKIIDRVLTKLRNASDYIPVQCTAEQREQANTEFATTLMGKSSGGPRWDRLKILEEILMHLKYQASGHQLGIILATLAWVSWFKANTSYAVYLLEQAQPLLQEEPLILQLILGTNELPQWTQHAHERYTPQKWT